MNNLLLEIGAEVVEARREVEEQAPLFIDRDAQHAAARRPDRDLAPERHADLTGLEREIETKVQQAGRQRKRGHERRASPARHRVAVLEPQDEGDPPDHAVGVGRTVEEAQEAVIQEFLPRKRGVGAYP